MKIKTLLAAACAAIIFLSGCKGGGTSGGGSGDAVAFKFNVAKGTKFSYLLGMNMDMNQSVMGQQVKMKTDIGMGYTFEVTGDSAGWKTMTATISKISMNMAANGMSMKYDSDSPSSDTTGPMGKMGAIMGAMKGGQFGFTMNENGEIGQVTGINEMVQKMTGSMVGDQAAIANQAIGKTFNEQSFKQNMQQSFAMYPGKPVKPGDSWSKKLTMDNNGLPMSLDNTYTLQAVEGNTLKVKVESKITSAGSTVAAPGMSVDMTGDLKGLNTFDQATGLPLSGDDNMTINMKMKGQGQEIPMKMDMKITITGKKEN